MKNLRTLLFDLDGTLLNSIEPILSSFAYVFAKYLPHKTFISSVMVSQLGKPLHYQMSDLCDGDKALTEEMARSYREHNLDLMQTCSLYPGAFEALHGLKERGYKLGIVTSKGRQSATFSLEQHKLLPLLDVFLCFEDTEKHKPGPEPIIEALRRLQAPAETAAYLGDATHDLHSAKAANVAAFAALWGPYPKDDLLALQPTRSFSSLSEFLSHF